MFGAFIQPNFLHRAAKAHRLLALLCLSLVLSTFLSTAVHAADGGKVIGTVKDQTGAVAPNVEVFSRVLGNHTIKVARMPHNNHVKQVVNLQSNGQFNFYGTQTGDDVAGFLLRVNSSPWGLTL